MFSTMNVLKRSITSKLSLFSHPSRNWRSLLYSTTYTLKPPSPHKRSQTPTPTPTPSSSSSKTEEVKLPDWPRPSKIPYQAKVANLVNLIGHIRAPVKFWTSPDGKYWASTVIFQDNDQNNSCLIPAVFEGDLAHIATFHVKENDCVYVNGRLSEEPLPFLLSEITGKLHLQVQNINFVEGFEEQRSRNNKYRTIPRSVSNEKGKDPVVGPWRDLVLNSIEWLDYREQKSNGLVSNKHPDFKRKDRSASLWLESAPISVLGRLECLDFDVPPSKDVPECLWKSLVENPKDWWDNRLDKKNPKGPDFKHKTSGEVLWLSKNTPEWALSKLQPAGEKQNSG